MPPVLMISNFIKFYGNDVWMNDRYDTSDHIIPHKVFSLMFRAMHHVQAYERLSNTHAHLHALAIINSSDKSALKKLSDDEFHEAYGVKEEHGR